MSKSSIAGMLLVAGCFAIACDDDEQGGPGPGNEAVRRGVGAECADDDDCTEEGQVCLTEFRGGMCGIADCTASSECPDGSVCVADPDFNQNYCLLVCVNKPDCNVHRSLANEANCSSSLNAIDSGSGGEGPGDPKVCRPPNG